MFHVPKRKHGMRAISTYIMLRFMSTASLMCAPVLVTVFGVYKNVSNASNVEWNLAFFPPGSKLGFILSI